jgi:hypothetical protein
VGGKTTSAGVEYPWGGASEGSMSAFLGKDAFIVNFTGRKVGTEFLIQKGDTFQLTFTSKSLWCGNTMRAQLFYYDDPNRIVVATIDANLAGTITWPISGPGAWGTYILEFNANDVPTSYDHRIGLQFKHVKTRGDNTGADNIWAELDLVQLTLTSPLMRAQNPYPAHESTYTGDNVTLTWVAGPNVPASPAPTYHVYFGDKWADVNSGVPAADMGLTGTPSYLVSSLVKGITYYWRIDTVVGAVTYRGNI